MKNLFDKIKCFKCEKYATWLYMPGHNDEIAGSNYFCDDCVSRGCSCNWLSDDEGRLMIDEAHTGIEDHPVNPFKQIKDERGRLLPCCEYNYNQEGYPTTEEE